MRGCLPYGTVGDAQRQRQLARAAGSEADTGRTEKDAGRPMTAKLLPFAPRPPHAYDAGCDCRRCEREHGERAREFERLILELRSGKPYPLRFT